MYQHEAMNRWGVPSSTASSTNSASSSPAATGASGSIGIIGSGSGESGIETSSAPCATTVTASSASQSPADSENNNNSFMSQSKSDSSSGANVNSTVSAAADSSDNQPPTPTPDNHRSSHVNYNNSNSTSNHLYPGSQLMPQDMHPYGGYMNSYEQYYPPPTGASMDYVSLQQQQHQQAALFGGNQQTGTASPSNEYKAVPSSRYHPYMSNANHGNHLNTNANSNNTSSSISTSSLSPRVVSSSSPSHNAMLGGQQQSVTPSPPKHCEKCGFVCSTDAQLNEHYASTHAVALPAANTNGNGETISRDSPLTEGNSQTNQFSYTPYAVKEEPASDILDLDSQKMVYPPDGSGREIIPPIHSMHHPLHRPLSWNQEMHAGYMPHVQPDMKQPFYSPIKQPYPTIKSEFPTVKSEYSTGASGFGNQMIKQEFVSHHSLSPQTRPEVKSFTNPELPTGNNPVSSSPSEFPSTTTPQENGPAYQQRFEPPTSSLSNPTPSAKSAAWKSNEARRPKTYNCTACNKWFTSSGHLKRHYNTTLHKNAVKSSGHPDPATMPISAHHHPSRDPNSKHHRKSQPPPVPPEEPRSPEYTPQFASPPSGGFGQQQQNFQQYHHQPSLNSSVNGHPNGLAGPSVQTSHPRGLLTISNTEASTLDQEGQVHNQVINHREDQYHHQLSSHNNNSSNNNLSQHHQTASMEDQCLSPSSSNQLEGYQEAISHHHQQHHHQSHLSPQVQQQQQAHIISHHHQYREPHHLDTIFTTPTTTLNIMEQQQQYIINPLAISTTTTPTIHNTTTIPSYQHLQLPAEHQANYHTIIGNNSQLSNNQTDNLLQLGSSFDMSTASSPSPTDSMSSMSPSTPSQQQLYYRQSHHQPQTIATTMMNTDGHILQIVPTMAAIQNLQNHHSLAELQRLSGGVPISIQGRASPRLSSPAVPESLIRISPFTNQRSPQEADVPPSHATASAPIASFPYSPTISSSTITTTTPVTKSSPAPKKSQKRKRAASPITGKIQCIECDKEFAKVCYLTQHNKTFHSGEQPFRCQKCGKRFQSEDVYETHLERHKSVDKPFKCDQCPKQFHHKTDLRRHTEAIHGLKAHVCETCNKGFCRKDHLRKHATTHTREKPAPKAGNRKSKAPTSQQLTYLAQTQTLVKEETLVPDDDYLIA